MKFQRFLVLVFAAALTAGTSAAASVTLLMAADDYGVVTIDGNVVITYCGSGASNPYTTFATLNLTDDWHTISIDYKNTTGTNGLTLNETYNPSIYQDWSWVSLAVLRSLDASGNTINGLRGDYFNLAGDPLKTDYGEGPIHYNGAYAPWSPTFSSSSTFEEILTGQIYIGSDANPPLGTINPPPVDPPPTDPPPTDGSDVPEPASWWLMAAALPLLVFSKLRLGRARIRQ
ncbi:MAG: hypothetical protein LAQ69_15515 [Acidobacteriia bacterium]|nr:hypothetical protein [Terriglobia bacterium]